MNDSKHNPNARTSLIEICGQPRIAIFARKEKDIMPGEELRFYYGESEHMHWRKNEEKCKIPLAYRSKQCEKQSKRTSVVPRRPTNSVSLRNLFKEIQRIDDAQKKSESLAHERDKKVDVVLLQLESLLQQNQFLINAMKNEKSDKENKGNCCVPPNAFITQSAECGSSQGATLSQGPFSECPSKETESSAVCNLRRHDSPDFREADETNSLSEHCHGEFNTAFKDQPGSNSSLKKTLVAVEGLGGDAEEYASTKEEKTLVLDGLAFSEFEHGATLSQGPFSECPSKETESSAVCNLRRHDSPDFREADETNSLSEHCHEKNPSKPRRPCPFLSA